MIPFTDPPRWPHPPNTARFASTVRTIDHAGCRIGLLGLADDLGVRLNGGRPGAASGPEAFRAALAKYGSAAPDRVDWPIVFDAGDIRPSEGTSEASLLETHSRITGATVALLDAGLFPIAIGGGHDLTLPFAKAVFEHPRNQRASREVVYFDAHLDVRDGVGSGMPFRRLIEDCGVSRLHLVGADPFASSAAHTAWFRARGGRLLPHDDGGNPTAARIASFDLDCLDASVAPGVSALNPCGLRMDTVEPMVRTLGANSNVRSFDIMELCPPHDADGRTARVAARLFLAFLAGFSERSA